MDNQTQNDDLPDIANANVRIAGEDDVDGVVALLDRVDGRSDRAAIASLVGERPDRRLWVAEHDGRIVAAQGVRLDAGHKGEIIATETVRCVELTLGDTDLSCKLNESLGRFAAERNCARVVSMPLMAVASIDGDFCDVAGEEGGVA